MIYYKAEKMSSILKREYNKITRSYKAVPKDDEVCPLRKNKRTRQEKDGDVDNVDLTPLVSHPSFSYPPVLPEAYGEPMIICMGGPYSDVWYPPLR